ncbi:hypothetical protein Taro_039794 [Colocasia esculenta]|uniref:Uncharacterized protein n=1 Tax=Colocasia esculenta TaxID=4460 RepID=A0A843WHH4_COLES|nr:hypothetical protein [Colocasia esculenta]
MYVKYVLKRPRVGQLQTKVLLQEVGMPRGLLPLLDIMECGYLEETGFVWVKQKKKVEHCFDKVGRMVSYAAKITAYVEEFRIRRVQVLVGKLHVGFEQIFWRGAFSLTAARFGSRSR